MSKRRYAGNLMFGSPRALKFPVKVVAVTSGTGTCTNGGVITILATAMTAGKVYITVNSGTNIGTLIGSYSALT